jgi:membrane-bound serine protease (ClpP class)
MIGDDRVDVVTEGAFIEKDLPIKVVAVEGNRVVVRET